MDRSIQIIQDLVKQHDSIRAFARVINEDPADIARWKSGKTKVKVRAVVEIVRLFGIKPHDLRPDWFPSGLEFKFND